MCFFKYCCYEWVILFYIDILFKVIYNLVLLWLDNDIIQLQCYFFFIRKAFVYRNAWLQMFL